MLGERETQAQDILHKYMVNPIIPSYTFIYIKKKKLGTWFYYVSK